MWIAFNSGLDVCCLDVSASLSSAFLFYPEVPRKIAGGAGVGSMKMSYNLLPARDVSCERDCLLMLADLFGKFDEITLSRLFFFFFKKLHSPHQFNSLFRKMMAFLAQLGKPPLPDEINGGFC